MNYSRLAKTWFVDFDGTIVSHKKKGDDTKEEVILKNVKKFFKLISDDDVVIVTTARTNEQITEIIKFMNDNGLKYDHIITNLPTGARILINDRKPSGYKTAYSINLNRDGGIEMGKIESIIEETEK